MDGKTFQTDKATFGSIFVPTHGNAKFIDALVINCQFNHVSLFCMLIFCVIKVICFTPSMFVRVKPIFASYRSYKNSK